MRVYETRHFHIAIHRLLHSSLDLVAIRQRGLLFPMNGSVWTRDPRLLTQFVPLSPRRTLQLDFSFRPSSPPPSPPPSRGGQEHTAFFTRIPPAFLCQGYIENATNESREKCRRSPDSTVSGSRLFIVGFTCNIAGNFNDSILIASLFILSAGYTCEMFGIPKKRTSIHRNYSLLREINIRLIMMAMMFSFYNLRDSDCNMQNSLIILII